MGEEQGHSISDAESTDDNVTKDRLTVNLDPDIDIGDDTEDHTKHIHEVIDRDIGILEKIAESAKVKDYRDLKEMEHRYNQSHSFDVDRRITNHERGLIQADLVEIFAKYAALSEDETMLSTQEEEAMELAVNQGTTFISIIPKRFTFDLSPRIQAECISEALERSIERLKSSLE